MLAQRWLYHEAMGQAEAADMMTETEEKGSMVSMEAIERGWGQEMDVKLGQHGKEGGS